MTFRQRAAQALREPLVHFLLIGALVFAVLSGRPADPGERQIVVDQAVVARLVERFSLSFRRVPTQDEIDGLIRDYVKDEVYYREALQLGLDRDDDVVRKRLRNKMIAVATGQADAATPSDAELQALLDKDPVRYASAISFDFEQVYLGDDTPTVRGAAAKTLARLRSGGAPADVTRPIPLPLKFTAASSNDIAAQFGDDFAASLRQQRDGDWTGPIASGLGLHLVRIARRSLPVPPKLADVRQRLENDWRAAALGAAEDANYRALLQGYDVKIELPK
jgi:peptidyl-prolyl cis-trans isomerase C